MARLNTRYLCHFFNQIQLERLRLKPQLPRLLQAEHQANSTGNRSRQGLDLEDTVSAERIITRRCFGMILFYRFYHPDGCESGRKERLPSMTIDIEFITARARFSFALFIFRIGCQLRFR